MARTLPEIIDEINSELSSNLTWGNVEYYNICKIIPKNEEGKAVVARNGSNISGKLVSLKRTNTGVIYHRVLEENIVKTPAKGRDSIQDITTSIRLVAWLRRPSAKQAGNDFDDQEIINECMSIINLNKWNSRTDVGSIVSGSTDYMDILDDEIGSVDKNKALVFEMTLFTIDYQVKRRQRCAF